MLIFTTGIFSIIIQIITGIIDAWGLTLSLPSQHQIFQDILWVEFSVQIVELIFYIWLVAKIKSFTGNVTLYRYFDWIITTPTMLITLMAFLNHNQDIKKLTTNKSFSLWDFLKEHKSNVISVVFLNTLMLVIGFIGELNLIPAAASALIGFIPFALYFKIIYDNYVAGYHGDQFSKYKFIFWYFVFFWALYGIAAFLPYTPKNVGYNFLDIFAKNILGVILVFISWKYHRGDWK